ncbi:DNA-3-methyladenine glycosylase [Candidatus Bathyarchaeota archaeon]|nr:DNA-3-methyladenine glycosylase [Candidatus Bathyarchaeota archaeon]NIR15965.1 DNA-3-methyladenine glycosylase [Desulfobacterales bacterium]NIU81373.1 DNA-3-methyladenine glycosylase [Candidatus Bathyarchaeota archaeon]NIV67993.1 DNA-3-methyladenine glycosylase [Candidatus Bathyarchaeota archaeon]NIW34533.1 DNA-3-methyladenine glycosylase [Candidatus Bathyarchaeota archaeon]
MFSSEDLLPPEFYCRDPVRVARELLGHRLIRRLEGHLLEGILVEAEAYLGQEDPASRAHQGLKNYNRPMWKQPGRTFIYNVHRYWMLNVVAHQPNQVGAVLIRALEPTRGIQIMTRNRGVEKLRELTSGPGKLTIALSIDNSLNGSPVTSPDSEIRIAAREAQVQVATSHRIGVKKDLESRLRFYIKENRFVSR